MYTNRDISHYPEKRNLRINESILHVLINKKMIEKPSKQEYHLTNFCAAIQEYNEYQMMIYLFNSQEELNTVYENGMIKCDKVHYKNSGYVINYRPLSLNIKKGCFECKEIIDHPNCLCALKSYYIGELRSRKSQVSDKIQKKHKSKMARSSEIKQSFVKNTTSQSANKQIDDVSKQIDDVSCKQLYHNNDDYNLLMATKGNYLIERGKSTNNKEMVNTGMRMIQNVVILK